MNVEGTVFDESDVDAVAAADESDGRRGIALCSIDGEIRLKCRLGGSGKMNGDTFSTAAP